MEHVQTSEMDVKFAPVNVEPTILYASRSSEDEELCENQI
jgi:hypothetical protein